MKAHSAKLWRRVALCALAAAVCALAFVFAMAALPTSPLPLWLPVLAAVCGGGLCAWVCFAGRGLRRQKTFRHWPARFAALICAALLCALALELFCFNHRAFLTRDCEPWELPLEQFVDAQDEAPAMREDGAIRLARDEAGHSALRLCDLCESTVAIRLAFEGDQTPLRFRVWLKDDASYYAYVEAGNGVCVPGLEGLDVFYGALYSNGDLNALELEWEWEAEREIYLTAVELNPQVPVSWQPIRMAVCFAVFLLALCMLRFPWRSVWYLPRRRGHRLVILLPMLLMMLLQYALGVCSVPKADAFGRGVWEGVALEDATQSGDAYAMLLQAFLHGKPYLETEPADLLLSLNNPYDRTERVEAGAEFLFDYALYNGKYYVYFGAGPVLLCYLPYYWLTGRVPSETLCGLWLSLVAIPLLYLAALGLIRTFTKRQNLFLLSLGCAAVACVSGLPMLTTAASRYENVMIANIAMMAGALGFGFHACSNAKPLQRVCLFLASGLCFGLQSMCRANTLLITTAFLAPVYVGVLRQTSASWRSRLRDGACFLLPAGLGVCAVMAYNFARFGSVAEFGQLYQLTMEDIRYNVFRLEYVPQALWSYLGDAVSFSPEFPFFAARKAFINVTGNYFWRMQNVGVLAYPLLWFLPLAGIGLAKDAGEERSLAVRRGVTALAPVIVCLALMVVTYFYAGVMQRYTHDFLPALSLVAALVGVRLCENRERLETAEWKAISAAFVAACAVSMAMSFCFAFQNERMRIQMYSPELYYALVRMFFPY